MCNKKIGFTSMSSTPLKICHYITTISRGGAENQLLLLVKNQIKSGNQVTIVPLKGELELYEDFENMGAKVDQNFVGRKFLAQILRIHTLKNKNYDIHHAHLPQAELLLAFSPIKDYIITRHFGGQFYPNSNPLISKFLSRIASVRARKVIAISESVKELLIKLREIKKHKKITVVSYGFDAADFVGKLNNQPSLKSMRFTIGTLARLSVEKDLPTLIKSIKILKSKDNKRDYQLQIFGDGELRIKIAHLIKELKLAESVALMGRTKDPAAALSNFNLFVLSSKFEGFGLVLLEAMSLNVPIIASKIPAAIEVLGTDGAGVFFEPGNADDLAEKILNLESYLDKSFAERQNKRLQLFDDKEMENRVRQAYEM
jgi:glycosyltransferase involved in cell wall biosynthesis